MVSAMNTARAQGSNRHSGSIGPSKITVLLREARVPDSKKLGDARLWAGFEAITRQFGSRRCETGKNFLHDTNDSYGNTGAFCVAMTKNSPVFLANTDFTVVAHLLRLDGHGITFRSHTDWGDRTTVEARKLLYARHQFLSHSCLAVLAGSDCRRQKMPNLRHPARSFPASVLAKTVCRLPIQLLIRGNIVEAK